MRHQLLLNQYPRKHCWFYGHDKDGNILVSTTRWEAFPVDGRVWLEPNEARMLCYCPKCSRTHCLERRFFKLDSLSEFDSEAVDFCFWAVNLAENCEEYYDLERRHEHCPRWIREMMHDPFVFSSQFHRWVLERAKDKEEFLYLWKLFSVFPRLAKRWIRGDKRIRERDVDYIVERVLWEDQTLAFTILTILEKCFFVPDEIKVKIKARILTELL